MKKREIPSDPALFPARFAPLFRGAKLYDSSCSPQAQVWFIDKEGGYFLKRSAKGSLEREALLGGYFHKKGLAPAVLDYFSKEEDWLLTKADVGEDATNPLYLSDPARLCDLLADCLHLLHESSFSDCPVKDYTAEYLQRAEENYKKGMFDPTLLPEKYSFSTAEQAWSAAREGKALLRADTLIHGDYCLPNIMLDNWKFSGFIDLDSGGVGDRHVDLFWGAWTLKFNLKTNAYRDRFFDAYGREAIQPDLFPVIAAIEIFG
jgi:kanamycin kinase